MTAYEFQLTSGAVIPQDNGYLVLSALSKRHPFLHGKSDIQIAPVRGTRCENPATIRLDHGSRLHIRGLTAEQAETLKSAWFMVNGEIIGIENMAVKTLTPSPVLVSRHVILKDTVSEEDFGEALKKILPEGVEPRLGRRRGFRIKGRVYIGYAVVLSNLSQIQSVNIQATGLGKFTSMGCGVFYPGRKSA